MTKEELLDYIRYGTDDRIYAIAQLIRLGTKLNRIVLATQIDILFLEKLPLFNADGTVK